VENIIGRQVGERVALVRNEMKMTQAELAREMTVRLGREVKPLTVTRLEGGKRPISVDELIAVGEALRIDPADLLQDKGFAVGTVRIVSAGQQAIQAMHRAHLAIREWLDRQDALRRLIEESPDYWKRVPPGSKFMYQSTANMDVQKVVAEAVEEFEDGSTEA
jgi:transcriptional regulator with XRE-family HTH domain